jgi:hypothetical protein
VDSHGDSSSHSRSGAGFNPDQRFAELPVDYDPKSFDLHFSGMRGNILNRIEET